MYVSSFHFVSPCFITSIEQVFWSVSSCFRVFPIFLYILFVSFVMKQIWVYKRKKKKKKIKTLRIVFVSSFHFVTLCFVTSSDQGYRSVSIHFTLFRNEHISNFLVCFIVSFRFTLFRNKHISLCFVTSIFQIFWSTSSCFRVFPIYLIHFICYETEMGL